MFKQCVLVSALLIGLTGLASYGQSPRLKAEIKLSRTSVKNNEEFSVSTIIRNTSNKEQSLVVRACGYGFQWTSDNPFLKSAGEDCLNNALVKVRLKAGDSYEKRVQVLATLPAGGAPKESIAFRLGFESERDQTAPPPASNTAAAPRLWSNAVTVIVTRQPASAH
ncbi:MAG: hypothetical protein P4L26_01260 [Terracidiphilus sp.]|nr:hypothetical protein [Terracidiphilus sp.]